MSEETPLATPLPEGARCAIHPDRTAERTCARCGNYLCTGCTSVAGSGLCLTCVSRVGEQGAFPFSRDRYSLDGLLKISIARWKENWELLLLAFGGGLILFYGVSLGGEWLFDNVTDPDSRLRSPVSAVRLGFQFAVTCLQLVGQLVLFGICVDLLEGKKPSSDSALARLSQAPNALLILVLTSLALVVYAGVHVAAFFAFGGLSAGFQPWIAVAVLWVISLPVIVYVMLGVMFAMLELSVDTEASAFQAIRTSWEAVAGHRFEVLGITFVVGVISVLGFLACCVGAIATIPLGSLIYCGLYLALRKPTPAPTA